MQQRAAETNYSETTFVGSAREHDDGYRVRIFTPAREIAFAGHPILGTAWVVRHHMASEASGPVRLSSTPTKGTRLIVTLNGVRTVDVQDTKLVSGPIALQYAAGVIKFRKLQIKSL